MTGRPGGTGLLRTGLALGGFAVAVVLGWYALRGADLTLLFGSWVVPAIALLHLMQQAGCGVAWYCIVEAPRPSRWAFFRARWVRASVAALVPVSGVGAAVVAVRLAVQAGLTVEMASASLILDATIEMITQILFTALGFALLAFATPESQIPSWGPATLSLAISSTAAFVGVQRFGGLKLVEYGISRLAHRWPRLSPFTEVKLHERLMRLHRQRGAALVAGGFHLGSWLLGAAEIWLVMVAIGHPASPATCIILESLSMVARSAGFFVPGALGVQEVALVMVGQLVGI